MSTRNVLIKSYIGSYQKEKHDPGTAVAWTKKTKRPKSFSVGGWFACVQTSPISFVARGKEKKSLFRVQQRK